MICPQNLALLKMAQHYKDRIPIDSTWPLNFQGKMPFQSSTQQLQLVNLNRIGLSNPSHSSSLPHLSGGIPLFKLLFYFHPFTNHFLVVFEPPTMGPGPPHPFEGDVHCSESVDEARPAETKGRCELNQETWGFHRGFRPDLLYIIVYHVW